MATISPELLNHFLRERRAIYPASYTEKQVPRTIVEQILENANWAPTHKRTEPWRFRVFYDLAARDRLGGYLSNWYRDHTPPGQFSETKFQKNRTNPTRAACVIAIAMQRDPEERLPEWEEVAAVACAVQNMWLSCAAYGIGCYWSTPPAILEADDFLGLREGEQSLGLFYMGYYDLPDIAGKRNPVAEKVIWIEE